MQPIRIKDGDFVDEHGRVIQLRGVNLDSSTKNPFNTRTTDPIEYDLDHDLTFINHPLPLKDVDVHINRLKSLGYNMIRFPISWESLEHKGPSQYDFDYMDYVVEVLKKIHEIGGIYVYLDPHQDTWSRACGGSGAPLWTLHCAGFNPSKFRETHAAVLHSDYVDPKTKEEYKDLPYPKMLWPTNYYKLACQTMFTLFFGGKIFAPKCIINDKNIQEYLQEHFIEAYLTLYKRIMDHAPQVISENCVIGFETMNEPNNGYIGEADISKIPEDRDLKFCGTPTAFESFMLGSGFECSVDWYKMSILGLTKEKKVVLNQNKINCWLNEEERLLVDDNYGWIRSSDWQAGTCIWRIHDVWGLDKSGKPIILNSNYFTSPPGASERVDERYFIEKIFLDYFKNFYYRFRAISKDGIIIMEPPVFKLPPSLKGASIMDDRIVCAGHFYDGYTIMFKKWSGKFTIDTYGMVTKKYANPVFSVVLGYRNVKKCIMNQLRVIREDSQKMLGKNVPMIFTEIGAPYDLDDKKAYSTGDYSSQTSALDAVGYGLEANNLSYSLWCYNHENSHKCGDNWNNEDFSIWSNDDMDKEVINLPPYKDPLMKQNFSIDSDTPANKFGIKILESDLKGLRALDSILRPFPICIHGKFQSAEFNHRKKTYQLKIFSYGPNLESKIFLPRYHFQVESCSIMFSSGKVTYNPEYQILTWKSVEKGLHDIKITGIDGSQQHYCVIN